MADGQEPKKKSLLGWLKNAVETAEQELAAAEAPPAPPPAPAPRQSGPLPGSGPLGRPAPTGPKTAPLKPGTDSFTRSAPPPAPGLRAPSTGQLRPASGPLPRPGSAPLTPVEPVLTPEEQEEESEKRTAFIIDYLEDPGSDEMFQDKQLVYAIVSAERTYQQQLAGRLAVELRRMGADEDPEVEEEREELEDRMEAAKRRQSQLFHLLKQLTGVKGNTGGTGWLNK